MKKKEDKNTRYFIDLDLEERKILNWDYDQRDILILHKFTNPNHYRIFITMGQYKKLDKKNMELKKRIL
jgi:hypothetical protein